MGEVCHYCKGNIRTSKDNYRTQELRVNGEWRHIAWHTVCDPFTVKTTVVYEQEQKP